jgi:hypothetical protein
MEKVTIKTNRQWRNFCYRNEVPAKVLFEQFDYLDEDEGFDGFFKYRGCWYHTSGFMTVPDGDTFIKNWQGYASDSFFSGIVINISRDGERYQVGTYIA